MVFIVTPGLKRSKAMMRMTVLLRGVERPRIEDAPSSISGAPVQNYEPGGA